MSKTPPIPPEQRQFGSTADGKGPPPDRRDLKTGLQSGQPGDADANLDQQGRFGNARQNLTPNHKAQAR